MNGNGGKCTCWPNMPSKNWNCAVTEEMRRRVVRRGVVRRGILGVVVFWEDELLERFPVQSWEIV